MPLVLQRGDPLAEEVVGVVAVEGDARTEDVDHRETRVLDGALDEPDQLLDVAREAASHVGGAVHDGRSDRVHRPLDVPERGALGLHAQAAARGDLSGREPVDLVVHHQVGEIHVAARGVREVVSADAVAVAVAAGDEHGERLVGHLHPGRHRQRPPVQGVHAVGVEVSGKVRRTADAAHAHDLVRGQTQLGHRHLGGPQQGEVAAARTPIGIDLPLEVSCGQRLFPELDSHFGLLCVVFAAASAIRGFPGPARTRRRRRCPRGGPGRRRRCGAA